MEVTHDVHIDPLGAIELVAALEHGVEDTCIPAAGRTAAHHVMPMLPAEVESVDGQNDERRLVYHKLHPLILGKVSLQETIHDVLQAVAFFG